MTFALSAARIAGLAAVAALPACTMAPDRSTPSPAALQQHVTHEGVAYLADVAPGRPGAMLTSGGALPVPGMTVAVWRTVTPLAQDQGGLAKGVARAACEQQGMTFNPRAIGSFAGAGEWRFAGACT